MIFSHFHAENNKKKKALHKRKISKLNNVGYIEKKINKPDTKLTMQHDKNNKKEISEKLNIKWTERLSYDAIKRQS